MSVRFSAMMHHASMPTPKRGARTIGSEAMDSMQYNCCGTHLGCMIEGRAEKAEELMVAICMVMIWGMIR